MPHLVWSLEAQFDLFRHHAFLKEKSPRAAARAVEAIQRGVRFILQFPQSGRPAEQYGPGRREWTVAFGDSGYVILYRYDGTELLVAAIRHGRELGYRALSTS
jgi:plasmid stabilization system protein ParE